MISKVGRELTKRPVLLVHYMQYEGWNPIPPTPLLEPNSALPPNASIIVTAGHYPKYVEYFYVEQREKIVKTARQAITLKIGGWAELGFIPRTVL